MGSGIQGAVTRPDNTGPATSLISNYLEDAGIGGGFVVFASGWGAVLTDDILASDAIGYETPGAED